MTCYCFIIVKKIKLKTKNKNIVSPLTFVKDSNLGVDSTPEINIALYVN